MLMIILFQLRVQFTDGAINKVDQARILISVKVLGNIIC